MNEFEPCADCGFVTPVTAATECAECGERTCECCMVDGLCVDCTDRWEADDD